MTRQEPRARNHRDGKKQGDSKLQSIIQQTGARQRGDDDSMIAYCSRDGGDCGANRRTSKRTISGLRNAGKATDVSSAPLTVDYVDSLRIVGRSHI